MMKQRKIPILTLAFITLLILFQHSANVARATPLTCGAWKLISSWNKEPNANQLNAVVAVASNNVWTVGYYVPYGSNIQQTMIQQWNGLTWSIIASPNQGPYENVLNGIAAVSATDIWAVGYYDAQFDGASKTLIDHWDGTKWSVVPSPNSGKLDNALTGVAVVSANDIWAVGNYYKNFQGITYSQTLTEHWNGTSWNVVASKNTSSEDNYLNGVTASSTSDVWAVGYYDIANNQTLIEHWDGTKWSIVPSPNPGKGFPANNVLNSAAAVSTNDVWAVGSDYNKKGIQQTMIEHWDGARWSAITSPNVGTKDNALNGVAIVSNSDLWAVGSYLDTNTTYHQTLTEQWNGTSWNVVPSANFIGYGAADNYLYGVTSIPGTSQAWSVGYFVGSINLQTLTEFYC